MESETDRSAALLNRWLALPEKRFSRQPAVNTQSIQCDCAGLLTLACDHLSIPRPYALERPRAVHYFAVVQEIGSSHISQLRPGSVMAWRKDEVPRSGDSGHVLVVAGRPQEHSKHVYQLRIIDATRLHGGPTKREIRVHTNADGVLTGVQLHLSGSKVKRTAIYHAPLLDKRYCLGCGVPKKICLCHQIDARQMEQEVVILRHPHERKKTLSTVSLVKQRYPQVLVKEGRVFTPIRKNNCALLFPEALASDQASEKAQTRTRMPNGPDARQHAKQTLLLLDATWPKAKRMVHDNPWLADLPRVSLTPQAKSGYLLRKGPGGSALSTVEAFALVQNDRVLEAHLQRFMARQMEFVGAQRYARNYRHHHNYVPSER